MAQIQLPTLSIRQPWAWLILHADKDIENRCWPTRVRGRVLIHASKGMTREEYMSAVQFAHYDCDVPRDRLKDGCEFDQLERGGIVGAVDIVDCVTDSDSPWFMGSHGFVLRNATPLPFQPMKGQLGFFRAAYGDPAAV